MTALRLIAAVLLLSLQASLAWPQDAAQTVIRPKRLVHFFDFDERKHGNFEDLPMHWYVIGRPAETADPNFQRQPLHKALVHKHGFPAYTDVRFDTRHALSGEHSFYLGLNGGSAGAFLEVGTLPAVPTSEYLITAAVRTRGLNRAAARIVAYYIDAQGIPLPDSRTVSPPIREADDWTAVSVKLSGTHRDAAWIGLELEVRQPGPTPDHPLGSQQVILQDVSGGVWFDDISVWQLPDVDVDSQSPVNVVRAPRQPELSINIRDLTGQRMRAETAVYDHRHRLVARDRRTVGAGEPMSWRWQPDLPGYGWYIVDLHVHEDADGSAIDGPVARMLSAILWLGPDEPLYAEDRQRFSLVADDLPNHELRLLPELLDATRLEAAVVSAWTRQTTLKNIERQQDELDDILKELFAAGRRVTLSLHPVPEELADQQAVDTRRPLSVMAASPDHWLPYLTPVLMRQGQRVRHWQLGRPHEAEAFYHGDLSSLLDQLRRRFAALAPQPGLIVPWRLDQSRRAQLGDGVITAVQVPAAAEPAHLPGQLDAWRETDADYWLHLHVPPANEVSHQRRVEDLALRMIRGWQAEADGLSLSRPWTPAIDRAGHLWPDPLLGVFANTAQRLAGRRVVGELPLGEGMQALIFDGPAGGMLAAWNRSAEPDEAVIDMYLGESPVAIDVWGNRRSVPMSQDRHQIALTKEPVFITGIDVELALLRASFAVTPSFVEALQQPHLHEVELRNPWQRTVSGSLLFTGPKEWSIQPIRHHFSLSPGQRMRLPVSLSFPFAELAGAKRLTARAEFTADRFYKINLTAPMDLGLKDVQFHPTVALEPGSGPGLMNAELVCVITNTGDRALMLSAFANLRNHPRQERSIANLPPGESIVRRFIFTDLTPEDRRSLLRTGVREANGPAVLNQVLQLNLR